MPESLPEQANLRQLQIRAKELAKELKAGRAEALDRLSKATGRPLSGPAKLQHAQWALAREYGFERWADLKNEVRRREKGALESALREFRNAVMAGEVAVVRKLLRVTPALRTKLNEPLFEFGSPAIRMAAQRKDLEMVDALLEAGADINQRSHWDPGSFGVLDGADPDLAGQLIRRGAALDIHAAAGLGKVDRLRELLDLDPKLVNARGGDGGSPLHFARDLEVVNLLLARGADVRMRDIDHGSTAAMWQVRNRVVLYRLIEAGSPIDIYMACVHGDRALADRALHENPGCLSAYVGHSPGDGPFAPDTGGNHYNWTIGHTARPIPVAAKFGHHKLALHLIDQATPADQVVALCFLGDVEKARKVLGAHPDSLERADNAVTRALPDAVHFGDIPAAKRMLDIGFPLSGHGLFGATALHSASWTGEAELVRQLVKKGACLEDRSNRWQGTPLQWACHGSLDFKTDSPPDHVGVVRALVEAGANTSDISGEVQMGAENWAAPAVMDLLKSIVLNG